VIVRGRAMFEGPEPAQRLQLFLAEPRNVGKGFGSRQNREKTQKQDFIERIWGPSRPAEDLACLTTIVSARAAKFAASSSIEILPSPNWKISDSASQPFVTQFLTRSK
jgi:hypothetical protein